MAVSDFYEHKFANLLCRKSQTRFFAICELDLRNNPYLLTEKYSKNIVFLAAFTSKMFSKMQYLELETEFEIFLDLNKDTGVGCC
jgi:hypothetical protein